MFEYGILENTPELLAIEMKGELNTVEANKLQQDVETFKQMLNKPILIDLTHLNYISSTGLRWFLIVKKEADANGQKVTIKGMNKNVASVFQMTGFDKMFDLI
ncbi:MAG: STAS domain-containing protein [Prevotella sp.]